MTYKIEFTETVQSALVHFPPTRKQRVKEALRYLSRNPLAGEPLKRELKGKRKFRIGRYRIVYLMEPAKRVILILAIGHRRQVYQSGPLT